MKPIAHIRTDFPTKFGLPRQSGLVRELEGTVVFEPEYRNPDAFRGLEEFSHIWLIWEFSEAKREEWSPTVRPPLLGGNKRMGVFATRSPFRPNPIGLSCVKLEGVEYTKEHGPILRVSGADLMDLTPIYDVKPYLAYADSHPDAVGGFTENLGERRLTVNIPPELRDKIPQGKYDALVGVLAGDPRPSYIEDSEREYGFTFADVEVEFTVAKGTLTVFRISEKG